MKFLPNFVNQTLGAWWDRFLGAVSDGSFADQEAMYATHKTTRDYIFNAAGIISWGAVFPVLTIVSTQLVGAEEAGMFSMAFIIALILMFLGNYGVRTYQISDLDEEYSFSDYQVNRVVTCIAMMVVGILYCKFRGYDGYMFTTCMGVFVYKMIDALADVYEGRLQQMDKFYLAGISQTVRSVAALLVFSLALLITRSLAVASIAMAVVSVASFAVFSLPLAYFETPKSPKWNPDAVIDLLKKCFPLFLALFLFNLIENMPKFVMEGTLSYDNQLYFNALYFPAQAILLSVGLIYKPLLVKLAEIWAVPEKRKRFDLAVVAIFVIILALTGGAVLVMSWIGIPVLSFMYGIDFEPMRNLSYVMLVAGGVTAAIDFLYQVVTVLRRQGDVVKLYLITFAFSLFVPMLLIGFTGLPGAILGYLIVMCILLSLLVMEYVTIRVAFNNNAQATFQAHEPALGTVRSQNRAALPQDRERQRKLKERQALVEDARRQRQQDSALEEYVAETNALGGRNFRIAQGRPAGTAGSGSVRGYGARGKGQPRHQSGHEKRNAAGEGGRSFEGNGSGRPVEENLFRRAKHQVMRTIRSNKTKR